MRRDLLFWLVVAIGALTVITGCVQILWPAPILALLSVQQPSPAALHFFGLVGMFMALFGGALLHALLGRRSSPVVVLWAGVQKFGAVAGVGIGVMHGSFAPLALFVTLFDFGVGRAWLAISSGDRGASERKEESLSRGGTEARSNISYLARRADPSVISSVPPCLRGETSLLVVPPPAKAPESFATETPRRGVISQSHTSQAARVLPLSTPCLLSVSPW